MSTTRPDLSNLHQDAAALSAFRAVGGVGRQYTVSEPTDPLHAREVIQRTLRRAAAIGFLKESSTECGPCYAVLDILDSDDEAVQDYCIPTAQAFRWWYRTLGLRVVDVEAEVSKARELLALSEE